MHIFENKIDFYITNVCNLSCQHCNRFNNHDFRGWQRWSDYEQVYQRWSELVQLRAATIMGGEPFLNATLPDWIKGINRLFDIEVQVLTNGTRFLHAPGVYDAMLYRSARTRQGNHIGVSLHIDEDIDQLIDHIHQFLGPGVTKSVKKQNAWGADWHFVDSRGVMINVYRSRDFMQSALIPIPSSRFTLHDNWPPHAHENCSFARWKSYHFIKGRLYKCGPVALLPEFDLQYNLEISDKDRKLLHSYQPLTVDNFQEFSQEFFAALDQPIAQCKFCSVNPATHKIFPVLKGQQ